MAISAPLTRPNRSGFGASTLEPATRIRSNTGGGNDLLTIDYSFGSPIPAGGVSFDGGTGTDSLVINGSASSDTFRFFGNTVQHASGNVSYSAVESLTLNTAAGNDTVNVDSVAPGTSATVNLGADHDIINVYETLSEVLALSGGGGTDQLTLRGSPGNDTFTATAASLQNGAALISFPTPDVEVLLINSNGGDDTYHINGTAPGAALTVNGSTGRDVAILTNLDAATYPAAVTFNAGGGTNDEVQLNDTASPGGNTFVITPASVTKDNGFGALNYNGVENMHLLDGTSSFIITQFEVTGTAPNLQLHIHGGNANDVYNIAETGINSFVSIDGAPGGDFISVNTDNTGSAVVRLTQSFLFAPAVFIGSGGLMHVGPGGNSVLRTTNLSMNAGATLDLHSGALIVDYVGSSPIGSITALLSTGYNAGEWNGAGIRSAAAANPGYALGFAEASDTFSTFPAIFAGQSVDNTTVLVRYTRYGDANLDGTVNLNDFNRLAANFGQSNRRWSHGDFDFSTNVNLNDFNLLAGNFGMSGSSPDWLRGREANRSSSSTSIDDERDLWIDQPGGAWQDVAR